MWDVCIRGARIVDPVQDLDMVGDVALVSGRIAEISPKLGGQATHEVLATGCLLVPGLTDLHAHVGGRDIAALSLPPDEAGVERGTTLLGDAGTAGAYNVDALLTLISQSRTTIVPFLNIHPWGIAHLPQDWSLPLDFKAAETVLKRHGSRIAGLKLLATANFAASHGLDGLRQLKNFASRHGLPLMIHLGTNPDDPLPKNWEIFCAAIPDILEAGDILSHCYTEKPGGLITPDRRFYPQLRGALARGVILDAAVALTHFSFAVALQGLNEGFRPHCISTDLTTSNAHRVVFDLPTTMSRFLALGLPLQDVVACVTDTPRRVLRMPPVIVQPGEPAELSLLDCVEKPYLFGENENSLLGHMRLLPKTVFWGDTIITASQN